MLETLDSRAEPSTRAGGAQTWVASRDQSALWAASTLTSPARFLRGALGGSQPGGRECQVGKVAESGVTEILKLFLQTDSAHDVP